MYGEERLIIMKDCNKTLDMCYKYKSKLDKMAKENPEEFEDLGIDFSEEKKK